MRLTEQEYEDLIKRRAGQIRDIAHQLNIPAPRNAEKLAEDTIPLSSYPVAMVKPREVPNRFEHPAPDPPTEDQEQRTVAQFLDLLGFRWAHPPNGGSRNVIEAKKFKGMGVKAGIPDILIFDIPPGSDYKGVAIELKRLKGRRLSDEQREWLDALSERGWLTRCCKGADEAIKFIREVYGK